MSLETIERDFREKVSAKIKLASEGVRRYRVFTPFQFNDGDHLAVILKNENDNWILSDEGHTFMHLTYELDEKDFQKGTRQTIITNALSAFSVEDRDGELIIFIENNQYGDALFSFVQALLKITDVKYLNREQVRSTFLEDFQLLLSETIPQERRSFNWNDPINDPKHMYTVDCRVNGMAKPLLVFALPGDDRTRDTTISILQFEKWGLPFRSLGIFEDQENINRKVLSRFTDVCEKQFSNIGGTNKNRITRYIQEAL